MEGKFHVTRNIVESFDAEEYLRRLQQLDQQKQQGSKQVEEITKMEEKYGALKAEAEKVAADAQEKMKQERDAANAEEEKKADGNPN